MPSPQKPQNPTAPRKPRPYIEEEHQAVFAAEPVLEYMTPSELEKQIEIVKRDVIDAARRTDFIEAARLRDQLVGLQDMLESRAEATETAKDATKQN